MSGPQHAKIQGVGADRLLNLRALNVHYNHLQRGFKTFRSCGVCSEGLEGLLATLIPSAAGDEEGGNPEGDGADEKDDAALPSDTWPGVGAKEG